MVTPYPLLFKPLLKARVWGGQSLARLGKPVPPGQRIGESWELADLPHTVAEGQSIIANGPLEGLSLRQALATHRDWIMGDGKLTADGGFPLLIKYLDASENLSVQVHPDEAYVARHPETHLKSEAWVVIDAKPGAVIYKGVKPNVTAADFAAHIKTGQVVDDLIAVPVRPGDCHYLPSGTCHALGAGILVAEVQTPSDTTFRVYDWGRPQNAGRELHIAQALECIHFGQPTDKSSCEGIPVEVDGIQTTPLAKTEYFEIERIDALDDADFKLVTSGLPQVLMMIAGAGRIQADAGDDIVLQPGVTTLIPAGLLDATVVLDRSSWMLRIRLPSPLQGLIA